MSAKAKKQPSFDEAMEELRTINEKIQSGEASIDDLSQMITRATELIAYCKQRLRTIEGDIEKVIQPHAEL